jgi:hypothetical protein
MDRLIVRNRDLMVPLYAEQVEVGGLPRPLLDLATACGRWDRDRAVVDEDLDIVVSVLVSNRHRPLPSLSMYQ